MNNPQVQNKERIRGALLAMQKGMEDNPAAIPGSSPIYPIHNIFSDGIYVRECRIPKGHFIMGRIHRREHPNILVQGSVMVLTEAGVEKLTAPLHMLSPAGTKRFLFTLEDTIWTTIHRTEAKTQEEAEEDVVTDSYEDIGFMYDKLEMGDNKCLL